MNVVLKWKDYSPRTFLNKVIYDKVPIKKKGKKVKDADFIMPTMENYNALVENNYKVKQLTKVCKYYKLKVSGNKDEKIHRIYNFLKYSHFAIKIQRIYRGFLIKKLIKLKGVHLRKKCVNDTDFLTFQNIKNIKFDQLFCFKDMDGFNYAFDIYSLYNLIIKTADDDGRVKNPYTRKLLHYKNVIYKLNASIFLAKKILKRNIKYKFVKDKTILSSEKKLEMKTISLFQKIDQLGYITDTKWYLNLSKLRLIRFIRELQDVWDYRAQISNEVKRNISPPNGNPFSTISMGTLMHKSELTLKTYGLDIMEKLLSSSDKDYMTLGANYILGVLTIVSQHAANAMPHLVEAFMPNPHH
tara:strand:+ start:108 stop:1175 length:1068 start_codon:yes stop_codon:yes gene_type:complete